MTSQEYLNYIVGLIDSKQWEKLQKEEQDSDNAVGALIVLLDHDKYRSVAIRRLGELGDLRAINPLIKLLSFPDISITWNAVDALDKIGFHPRNVDEAVVYLISSGKYDQIKTLGKKAVDPLLRLLLDGKSERLQTVINVLGDIGDKKAVTPLLKILEDKEKWFYLRQHAAMSLGQIGDERAVEPIIEFIESLDLESNDGHNALPGLLFALGSFGASAIPYLRKCLDKKGYVFRGGAAKALKEANWEGETPEEKVNILIELYEWDEIVKLGASAVEPLINAYKRKKYASLGLKDIVLALGKIGDPRAVKFLINALGSLLKNGYIVYESGYEDRAIGGLVTAIGVALSQLGEDAVGDLLGLLDDEILGKEATRVLGKIGDPRAVMPLIEIVQNENRYDTDNQRIAILALGDIGDQRAVVPILENARRDSAKDLRVSVRALGKIGDPGAVDFLVEQLGSEEDCVKDESAQALAAIGDPKAIEPLVRNIPGPGAFFYNEESPLNPYDYALESYGNSAYNKTIKSFGEQAINLLVRYLTDDDPDRRYRCAYLLEFLNWEPRKEEEKFNYSYALGRWDELKIFGKRAVDPLITALLEKLKTEGPFYIFSIEYALRDIKEHALYPVINLLSNSDAEARASAARILGEMEDEKAIEPLIIALSDEDQGVREEAKRGIKKIGGPVAESLLEAFYDSNKEEK